MEILTKLELVLDGELLPIDLKPVDIIKFNEKLVTKGNTVVRDCIDGTVRHNNYLEYLGQAWNSHRGIIVSPELIWHVILNELASTIKNDFENYREYFSTSSEKVEIVVQTNDSQLLPLDAIMNELKKLVPTDVDIFLPDFSTNTESSELAMMATFADAMSPFYNYGMLMCGISKVRIQGTESDWNKIINHLNRLGEEVFSKSTNIISYIDKVNTCIEELIHAIENESVDFFKTIFRLDRCGSGSEVQVKGWIQNLFIKIPKPGYINNYPTCVSYVRYKNLTDGNKFELVYGLLSSIEEDGYLIPNFGYLITQEK